MPTSQSATSQRAYVTECYVSESLRHSVRNPSPLWRRIISFYLGAPWLFVSRITWYTYMWSVGEMRRRNVTAKGAHSYCCALKVPKYKCTVNWNSWGVVLIQNFTVQYRAVLPVYYQFITHIIVFYLTDHFEKVTLDETKQEATVWPVIQLDCLMLNPVSKWKTASSPLL
jgi:hypothetical protein